MIKLSLYILVTLFITSTVTLNEDFIDTESEPDEEAALKCDSCILITKKFVESFVSSKESSSNPTLNEEEIIEAVEATCDDTWQGYGIKMVNGVQRLSGPDAQDEVKSATGNTDVDDPTWTRRLQDMCDDLLAESPDERTIHNLWASDNESLQKYLCKGEGSFGACATEDWGPWPGDDDYDDYEDNDFDYVHDEF